MQENERWMALVQERNRIRQIAAERSQLIHNAKGKTVEYFDEKIAATKELEKRVWLIVAALESEPQVFEWVQKSGLLKRCWQINYKDFVCVLRTATTGYACQC